MRGIEWYSDVCDPWQRFESAVDEELNAVAASVKRVCRAVEKEVNK